MYAPYEEENIKKDFNKTRIKEFKTENKLGYLENHGK